MVKSTETPNQRIKPRPLALRHLWPDYTIKARCLHIFLDEDLRKLTNRQIINVIRREFPGTEFDRYTLNFYKHRFRSGDWTGKPETLPTVRDITPKKRWLMQQRREDLLRLSRWIKSKGRVQRHSLKKNPLRKADVVPALPEMKPFDFGILSQYDHLADLREDAEPTPSDI